MSKATEALKQVNVENFRVKNKSTLFLEVFSGNDTESAVTCAPIQGYTYRKNFYFEQKSSICDLFYL